MSTTPHPKGQPSASTQGGQPQQDTLPPEYEAILVAAREIESDYRRETERSRELQEKIRESRDQMTEMKKMIDHKDEEAKKLESRFSERFDTLEGEMVAFRRQMSDLQNLVRGFVEGASRREDEERESFRAECERLRQELAQNQANLTRVRAELDKRVDETERAVSTAEIEKVRAEAQKVVSELKLKIEELQDERRRARASARSEAEANEKKLKEARDESAARISSLETALKEVRRRADLLDQTIRGDIHVIRAQEELREYKREFARIAATLRSEIDYLRKIFPLRALLGVKNGEIDRLKKTLRRLRFDHSDRPEIEAIVKEQIRERDSIRAQIEEAERLFDQQLRRVNDSAAHVEGSQLIPPPETVPKTVKEPSMSDRPEPAPFSPQEEHRLERA